MDPALRAAATGMMAQQTRTEVIANNLANVNTTGFKRSRAHFEDLLYQTVQGAAVVNATDASTTPAIQVGRGTRLAGVERMHSQGALEQTNRPLDLAIQGEGFFQVQLPNGQTAYTRDGSFQISDQGTLVTSEGHTIVPGIKIPAGLANLAISPNGIVTATMSTDAKPVEIGRIELARFANPSGLQSMGGNLMAATSASGDPATGYPDEDGIGQVSQGYLEASNVEIVQEMVDMISAMRAYEINSKAVKNSESMADISNNLVR
ncbi:MAG: flagellar basal-body rod protein FlgG [Gemmatimonadetes bacterium]|nr:flagellar basal-body rod protein FlgG [Gemmatimonadota bacterium]